MVGMNKYVEQQEQTITWKHAKKTKKLKKKKGQKGRTESSSEEEIPVVHEVNREVGEMPDNARSTDEEGETDKKARDPFKALDINLDE